jgi:hypothetical protein
MNAIRLTVRDFMARIEPPQTHGQAVSLANALQAEAQRMWLRAEELRRRGAVTPDPPEKGEPGTRPKE